MTNNRAFRDYATRVSFNMTLSRNQIGQLRMIVIEIEHGNLSFDDRMAKKHDAKEEQGPGYPDNFIAGRRALTNMGVIEHDPRFVAENKRLDEVAAKGGRRVRQYWGPSYRLTDAGEHVVALLRIAGLLQPAAVNSNTKKRKSA